MARNIDETSEYVSIHYVTLDSSFCCLCLGHTPASPPLASMPMGGGGLEEAWCRVLDLNLEFYGCLEKLKIIVYTVPYVHGALRESGVHATSPGTFFGAHRDVEVRAVLTEHAFQKEASLRLSLAESYDFETHDGFVTGCDFVVLSIERRFVKGVVARGGDRSSIEPMGIA